MMNKLLILFLIFCLASPVFGYYRITTFNRNATVHISQNTWFLTNYYEEEITNLKIFLEVSTASTFNSTEDGMLSCYEIGGGTDSFSFNVNNSSFLPNTKTHYELNLSGKGMIDCTWTNTDAGGRVSVNYYFPTESTIPGYDEVDEVNAMMNKSVYVAHQMANITYKFIEVLVILLAFIIIPYRLFETGKWSFVKVREALEK